MDKRLPPNTVQELRRALRSRLREDAPLAKYTSSRTGGCADVLITIRSSDELAAAAEQLWAMDVPFRVLGGGSNVLIADEGFRGAMLLNQAKEMRFWEEPEGPMVRAESGASLAHVARRAVERGWSGLEWAGTIPGTVGGAIVGNAGAHGGDVAGHLRLAEILQRDTGKQSWTVDRLEYTYRDSWLKRNPGKAIVLAATFPLSLSTSEETKARLAEFITRRRQTQPQGASWGSMFKNPPGDFAGRLIEAAGLKGTRIGGAQISSEHANFFINLGDATSADVWQLIQTAQETVSMKFGVRLELEVELVGDWGEKTAGRITPGESHPS